MVLEIDGKTKGPNTFSGVMGKEIEHCETLPITEFKEIYLPELP
jgi:hypothetical protein